MNRRSQYDEYDFEDDDNEEHTPRRFKKEEEKKVDKKKSWDRESLYDRINDFNDRR
jgi:hypothetical protein